MPTVTRERRLPIAPAAAYSAWLEAYEAFPKFYPERFARVRVLESHGNERTTECEEIWGGRHMTYRSHELLDPPRGVEQTVTSGGAKGSVTRWSFEPDGDGTRVVVEMRLRGLEGVLLGTLLRRRFERDLDATLDRWSRFVLGAVASPP